MKNLIKTIVLIALAVSCVNEIGNESIPEASRRYALSFEDLTKTDISGTGSSRSISWTAGDQIKYYTESNQSNPASADVTVESSSAYVNIPRGRTDEFINAVYGAIQLKSGSSTDKCMYVSSPVKSNQRYTSFAQAHVCAAFSDDLEEPSLRFRNAACILRFTSAADVHTVVFSGNNGEVINAGSNGDLKITCGSGGALTIEPASGGQNSVTIATNGEEGDFYFAILPVSFDSGISVKCYDSYGALMFTKKTGGAINTVTSSGAFKMLDLGKAQDWIDTAPPEPVDLGLSVKWANYNLGASKPEGYGDYFAWGEIAPKNEYKWGNYLYGTAKNGPFSKYVLDAGYGTIDYKLVLDLEDDAAHTIWGDDWRMPTKEEVAELMNTNNCTWTWTTRNGVNGYTITSRMSGYTSNSIFLPANGMRTGSSLSDEGTIGNYWSSSISDGGTYYSISPFFSQSSRQSDNCYRYFGLGVRPVYGAVVPVSEITLPETLILTMGKTESATLTATVLPENATHKGLTWVSSDTSVATVDVNGKVTAVSLGTATVTVYSADGTQSSQCKVDVNQPIQSITLDKETFDICVGDEPVALIATILPEENTDKVLNWTSANTSVATVDADGRVTALSAGTATITATARDGSGKKASCVVTVYESHVKYVTLDNTKMTLYVGKSATLTAMVNPVTANNKVLWSSLDENVAKVDATGKVTAVAIGSTRIRASTIDGSKSAFCRVTVNQYVTSISLDKTSIEIYVGDNPVALTATVLPDEYTNKTLTWSSSKTSVATVDDNGLVFAISNGTATITATAQDGSGKKATCKVTVLRRVESVSLDRKELTLGVGKSTTLIATVSPSNASNKNVVWTSDDESVAKVDQSGIVTAVGAGKASITVLTVDGAKTASCEVTAVQFVESITLDKTELVIYEGDAPVSLTATVLPNNATDKSLTWTSSSQAIATVDFDGKVTAVSKGSTTITVMANDGSNVIAECMVTVKTVRTDTNGRDYVDLGLPSGLLWATCNLGATKPEESGEYFAWGETQPKEIYNWSTYKWCNGSSDSQTKYCPSGWSSYWGGSGSPDNKLELDSEDDAASANWGGSWRMPTDEEWTELISNCTWKWTNQNGYSGRLVTGPNGNSIFLPAAGLRYGSGLNLAGSYGYYWSSSLRTDGPYSAYNVYFNPLNVNRNDYGRYYGQSVRPVSE